LVSFFLASFVTTLFAFNEEQSGADASEKAIEVVMIVIAAIIVIGMAVIIITIVYKLREIGTASNLNNDDQPSNQETERVAVLPIPTLHPFTPPQSSEQRLPPVDEIPTTV